MSQLGGLQDSVGEHRCEFASTHQSLPTRNSPNPLSRRIPRAGNRMWVSASSVESTQAYRLLTPAGPPQLPSGRVTAACVTATRVSCVAAQRTLR